MAGGNIEGTPYNLVCRSGTGGQVGSHSIVYIGEIATLFAIPEDRGWFTAQHMSDEPGQHARVGRVRVLAGTKNVEVTQADGFQPINAIKRLHVEFARQFGNSIR